MQVRDPVPRSLDIIAAELLLSASQAFLVGVLMYLAIGIWDDRGVGFGPVAVTLAGLGLVIGGAWLYWLSGGVGWPLAAGNVPVAIFLGFALVLGWQGGDIVRVEGVPLLLSLSASVYGLVCGVFLDSPRRRRWDQRQKPRPGAPVPRISPTTRMFVARVPRSVPRRSTVAPAGFPTMSQEQAAMAAATDPMASSFGGGSSRGALDDGDPGGPDPTAGAVTDGNATDGRAIDGSPAPGALDGVAVGTAAAAVPVATRARTAGPTMPTDRLDRAARDVADAVTDPADQEAGGIELPTALEPRAQRSPWAWAAPPEWTRDEEDEPPRARSSGGT